MTPSTKKLPILQDCQHKLTAFQKGQARVKRGRYKEAVDLFTIAMNEGEQIPHRAPLYGILLTERAETNLLSDHYEASLKDCAEAIALKQGNLTAWTVKIEVYYALGRLQEARDELSVARKSWGARNDVIEDAYKKTDFELRLQKVDNELRFLVATVECGKPTGDDAAGPMHSILHLNHSQRRNRSVDDNNNNNNHNNNNNNNNNNNTNNKKMMSVSPFRGMRAAVSPKEDIGLNSNNNNNNNNNNTTTTINKRPLSRSKRE